jgi:cytochrome b
LREPLLKAHRIARFAIFLQIRKISTMTTSEFLSNEIKQASQQQNEVLARRLIWDVPLRVGHWLLVVCFAGAWLTSESEYFAQLHLLFGYSVLAFLVFRLFWGFAGSRYARWSSFIFSREELWNYMKSPFQAVSKNYFGHNPLGSVGIFLMLISLFFVVGTGLTLDLLTYAHWLSVIHEVFAELLLVLIFVHIAGIVLTSWLHRQALVPAMFHGKKLSVPLGQQIPHNYLWGLIVLFAVVSVSFYYVLSR